MKQERGRGCVFLVLLWLMQVFFTLGAVLGVLVLLGLQEAPPMSRGELIFYTAYFIVGAVCAYAIYEWKRWGVYGLAAASAVVVAVNILRGTASLEGALFGLLFAVALAFYIRASWRRFR
ncbi:MAG: hypothetical protein ACP5UM_00990 [Anaerolineae bacterium]